MRETGWVYLKANRVPRKIEEMVRTLEKTLPKSTMPLARASG